MRIREKIILGGILLTSAPFLIGIFLTLRLFSLDIEEAARARAQESIQLIKKEFAKIHDETCDELRTFTSMLPIKRSIMLKKPMALRHQLVPLLKGFRFDRLDAWDSDLVQLMRAEAPGDFGNSISGDPVISETASGAEVKAIIKRIDGIYLEAAVPILVDSQYFGGLRASYRLDRKFLGRIAALLGVEIALQETSTNRDYPPGPSSSQASFASASTTPSSNTSHASSAPLNSPLQSVSPGSGPPRSIKVDGQDYMVISEPLMDIHGGEIGYITAGISLSLVGEGTRKSIRTLFSVLIACLSVTVFLGILVGRRVSSFVRLFRDAATRMAGGSLAERVSVTSQDEVGELAEAFNRMARNLETLFRLSRESAFAGNVESLIQLNIKSAVEALGALRGSLMLYDAKRDCLAVNKVIGFEGAVTERVSFKPGEGIAGIAFSTRATVVSDDLAGDPRVASPHLLDASGSGPVTIIATPLISEEETVGVLTIVNRRGTRFDSADRSLLETVAAQVAAAIARARLFELAITDGLTGLFIHRYFQARLHDELQRSKRHQISVTLIMTDIDHFKRVNDTYGHQQGDRILRGVADLVRAGVRSIDIPARYGGEEFAVVLPNTSLEDGLKLAERLRASIEKEKFPGMPGPGSITISLGVATCPLHAAGEKTLIECADRALYQSKDEGRNRVTAGTTSSS
ncbi:MAG: diguanylate cyclase [Candidatus Ozemobacteraceae bacterium]